MLGQNWRHWSSAVDTNEGWWVTGKICLLLSDKNKGDHLLVFLVAKQLYAPLMSVCLYVCLYVFMKVSIF